ncbi:MAG: UvrD-helicase domain-containing protein [Myxococcota bacterium]
MTGYWARPAVLDQISPEFDAVIEASAGTGKTYTLEHLVIDLVLRSGLRLEEILVVTFTEKAAAELAQRLRAAMVRIRSGPWPDDSGWRIDEQAQTRLGRALTSFDAASISTIHAFCKRMLAEHAFVNGRLFREELVDGRAAFQETFLDVVRKTLATDPALTPYVTAWLQKDTLDTLTERLYEAHTRGGIISPPYDESALISTLRSMSRLGLSPTVVKPTLLRAGFRGPTISACLNRIKVLRAVVEGFHRDQNPAGALAHLEDEDGRRRAEGGLFEFLQRTLAPVVDDIPRLAELHRAFVQLDKARVPLDAAIVQVALPVVQTALATDKRTSGRFDFDDMLSLLDQALEGPAKDALLETLRRRFKVALIDEFQDTDRVQWSIFRRVFAESPHHRLVVIGDPKQAIYGFRGADVHTYLAARDHLTGNTTSVVHLTQTYRATPALSGVLNRLLDQQRPTPFFTGAIRYDHPVSAAGAPPQLLISERPVSAMHLFQIKPRKDTVAPSVAVRTLNARIAEEVGVLLNCGTLVGAKKEQRPVSASDIFILTRTTKEGVAVAEALRRRGLPYAFYKQDGLFQTQEAEDVRTLLAAVAEPHDRGRRLRAWIGPFFAVPIAEAQRCLSLPGSHPLLATLFRFRGLADERKWARLFPQILADTGIIQRELFLADSERELTNYLHIFEILLDEAIRTRATLTDILQTLTGFIAKKRTPEGEDGNVQRLESERAAVQIMTMHKAKGLEAAIVFITGGISRNPGFAHIYHEDGQRRLYLGDQPPSSVIREREEEDQRLAYVALTRAKTRLYLPYYGGRTQPVLGHTMGTYEIVDRALDAMLEDEGVTVEPLIERTFRRTEDASQPCVEEIGPVNVSLKVPAPPPEAETLRTAARGAVITSYSRLKQAQGGYQQWRSRLG